MNIRAFAYLIVVLILLNTGCKKKNDIEEQRYLWSSEEPMTIPLRIRMQRYEKGNLIRNPSFETGKVYKLDSIRASFDIDNWQQIGRDIEWVNTEYDSIYQNNDAYSGKRAVKITRKTAYETDKEGEGILSDFIKVIPGNYSLSFFARVENVKPNAARLGTRMYDGIEVSLRYFDRNKNLLKSVINYPIENQKIDASYKELSFANYKQISQLGWSKIIGKTHGFPFPDGDIPTEAHFVKIYIGLKGTGTLWIDSVNFNYTNNNFSALERMQPFTDTSFHATDVLIPTPKQLSKRQTVIFGTNTMTAAELPLVLVSDQNLMEEAALIRDALKERLPEKQIQVVSVITDEQVSASRLIISIGPTSLYQRFKSILPLDKIAGKPQGYFIVSPGDFPNVVLIGSETKKGIFNAVTTAVQMVDPVEPYFHNAFIIDFPDFEERYCTFLNGMEISRYSKELIRYKINGAFSLNTSEVLGNKDIHSSASSNQSGDIDPYFSVIPVNGYVPPNYGTLTYDYPYTVATDTILPVPSAFEFPAVFHNEMLDNSDYAEMCCQLPLSGKRIYSGSSFFSLNTDAADVQRFESIFGPSPVFMDNSMLIFTRYARFGGNDPYYPGKIRLFNIFSPYSNTGIQELYPLLDTSVFAVNLPVESEIELIRLATAADFMWNMSDYSMDYSLWKVLVSRYGTVNAKDLTIYADQYSIFLQTITNIENNVQVARNLKVAQNTITKLTSITSEISARLGSQHNLIRALQQLNSKLRNRLNQNRSIIPSR